MNVALVGSRGELCSAMRTIGWHSTDPVNLRSQSALRLVGTSNVPYPAARASRPATPRRNSISPTNQWAASLATQRHLTWPDAGAPVQLWQAEPSHVRDYTAAFVAADLSAATINSRLAAISSFYSFVIGERRLIGGIEMCLFADATGAPRSNPFRAGNLQRPTRPAQVLLFSLIAAPSRLVMSPSWPQACITSWFCER